MEQLDSAFKWLVALLGTAATYLWGGWDAIITALVVLVVLDYVTGVMAAWAKRELSSETGARGIARKIGIFVVVALANVIDQSGGLGEPVLRTVACWFYIANEGISILENLVEVGVPVPDRLRDALQRLQGREGGDGASQSAG